MLTKLVLSATILFAVAPKQTGAPEKPAEPPAASSWYSHLPSEQICAFNYQQAIADQRAINEMLALVGGWQRERLMVVKKDADMIAAIWYAVWWITWSQAGDIQRIEWRDMLIGHVGTDRYYRGDFPEPFGLGRLPHGVIDSITVLPAKAAP